MCRSCSLFCCRGNYDAIKNTNSILLQVLLLLLLLMIRRTVLWYSIIFLRNNFLSVVFDFRLSSLSFFWARVTPPAWRAKRASLISQTSEWWMSSQKASSFFTKRRTKMSCVNITPSTTAPRCHRPSSVGRSTRGAAVRANLFLRSRDTQQQQQQHKAPSSLSLCLTTNDRNKKLNSLRTFRVQSEGDDGE